MYRIKKRLEIAGAHQLTLPYESKCEVLHGHNWVITVEVEAEELDANGMVCDFGEIKGEVMRLDHAKLNTVIPQPTAEHIAFWIFERVTYALSISLHSKKDALPRVVKVTVQESEGNEACYIP